MCVLVSWAGVHVCMPMSGAGVRVCVLVSGAGVHVCAGGGEARESGELGETGLKKLAP